MKYKENFLKKSRAEKEAIWKRGRPYFIFLIGVAALGLIHGIQSSGTVELLEEIQRGEFGSGGKRVGVEATASYDGISVRQEEIGLLVREMELTDEEKKERIETCKEKLPQMILGRNERLDEVGFPLHLPSMDEETGVTLEWSCDNPALIDEKGNVNVIEGQEHPLANLTATLSFMGLEDQWTQEIRISREIDADQITQSLYRTLKEQTKRLSETVSGDSLVLPEENEAGVHFQWKSTSSFHAGLYLLTAIAGCLMIYINQKQQRIRKQEEIRTQIEMQLPDFMNKIVMLLSAGLVLTDAFDRIAKDYLDYGKQGNGKILYEEFTSALRKAKESNGSFAEAMVKLAQKMEVKELTRFAVVVSNNLEKGNKLADKLEMESNLLWRERKSKIEKLGRVADTKMTFPMMITLLSLVVITRLLVNWRTLCLA